MRENTTEMWICWKLGKTEKTAAKVLECPVKFNCKSLFYSNQVDRFVVSRSKGELRWDFTWPPVLMTMDSEEL